MRPVLGLRPDHSGRTALLAFAVAFLAVLSGPACASPVASEQIGGLVAAGAIALAIAASLWAAALAGIVQKLRRRLNKTLAAVRASVSARDALLSASRDSVVVWNADQGPAWGYGGADSGLQPG